MWTFPLPTVMYLLSADFDARWRRAGCALTEGVGMGLGLGQHHPGLGMQRQQNDQSSARAALQQSMIFAPQTHDSERTKP